MMIESLFLFDAAFLISEIITIWPYAGMIVAICLFALGMMKLLIMLSIAEIVYRCVVCCFHDPDLYYPHDF